MGKLTKVRKKSKSKTKKSTPKTKSKINPTKKSTSESGAPEIKEEDISMSNEDSSTTTSSTPIMLLKLNRRAMKVTHIECEDKAIRKAQRNLKRAKNGGNEDEINEAQLILDEAVEEKMDASVWMHPNETIEKLSHILNHQIENLESDNIINQTKKFILEAEDSLRLINQGQEDAFFFQLQESQTLDKKEKREELNSMIEEINQDANSEILNIPPIDHQMNHDISENTSMLFSQAIQQQEMDAGNEFDTSESEDDDSQKTPIIGSLKKPINLMQKQLNEALKVLSPREKLEKMRLQAKMNAAKRQSKLNQLWRNNNTSSKQEDEMHKSSNIVPESSQAETSSSKNETMEISTQELVQKLNNSDDDDNSQQKSSNIINQNSESDEEFSDTESQSSEDQNKRSMKQSKITITRTYNTYFAIKMKVEKGKVPTQQLVKALETWFSQLLLIDPSSVIYGYENEIPTDAILKVKNIPSDISAMKKFFANINIKPNGGYSWFQVWIGHDDTTANIITNMKYWSSENNIHMYKKRLQQKFSSKDYWLMWSTERMDTEVLHNQVSQIIKKSTNENLQFSFNFGSIRKDTKQFNANSSKWNRAIIIEAKREEKDRIYHYMGKIFSSKSNVKLLGTNMRLVPMMSNDLPSHTKSKIAHLVAKQEQFLSTLTVKPCVFLNEIDYFNTTLNTTMRDIIMDLETLKIMDKKGNPMKVFLNVDYSQWHSSYVLTFPQHLESEADDYISQLPAYLHYVYGNEILMMLTAEGAAKAQTSKWDPEKLCATSTLDIELDAVTTESKAFGWLPDLKEELIQFDISNIELQSSLHQRATDADSISTFAKKAESSQVNQNIVSPPSKSKMFKAMPDKFNGNEDRVPHSQGNMNTSSSSANALEAAL